MKLKYKLTLAALAFAAAGQANASIADFVTGNGEMFFSVWDPTTQVSYTRDLGITMNDFLSGTTAAGFNTSFAADANLTNFMAGFGGNTSNLIWNVAAGDSTGGNGFNAMRYLTTTSASLATVQSQSNTALTKFSGANLYVDSVNVYQGGTNIPGDTTGVSLNLSSTASGSDPAYTGGINGFGNKWGGNAVFDSTGKVGDSLFFYFMTPSSTSAFGHAYVSQFGNTFGSATWSFDGSKLAFSMPAPAVPEADTWAMLGLGLVGVGAIARRKSKKIAA